MYNNFGYPYHYYSVGFGPEWFLFVPIIGIFFFVFIFIAIALKGYSLWVAARRDEKWWFIALLVINTLGLFELFYLIVIAKVWFQGKGKKVSPKKSDSDKIISA